MMDVAGDVASTVVGAGTGMADVVVGAGNMMSGGRFGKALEEGVTIPIGDNRLELGYRPDEAKSILSSDASKFARKEVSDAEGVVDTAKAVGRNPELVSMVVGESLGAMGLGGVVSKGLMKAAPKMSALVAGAMGEGTVMAGAQAENIRRQSEDKLLSNEGAAAAVGTGLAGALIGVAGGKLAEKLGFSDVNTMMASAKSNPAVAGSVAAHIVGSSGVELGEEVGQTAVETITANLALGRPVFEGIDEAVVLGGLAGGMMGAGAGARNAYSGKGAAQPEPTTTLDDGAPAREQGESDADYQMRYGAWQDEKSKPVQEYSESDTSIVGNTDNIQEETDVTADPEIAADIQRIKDKVAKTTAEKEIKDAKSRLTAAEKNIEAVINLDPAEPGYKAAVQEFAAAKKALADADKAKADLASKADREEPDMMTPADIRGVSDKVVETEGQERKINKFVDSEMADIEAADAGKPKKDDGLMTPADIRGMADKVTETERVSRNIEGQVAPESQMPVPLDPDMVQEISQEEYDAVANPKPVPAKRFQRKKLLMSLGIYPQSGLAYRKALMPICSGLSHAKPSVMPRLLLPRRKRLSSRKRR